MIATNSTGSFFKRTMLTLSTLVLVSGMTACGKTGTNQYVKAIYVETDVQDNDNWVSLNSTLNVANLSFPSLRLPIVDPRDPSDLYGTFEISPIMGSTDNALKVALNLSKVSGLPGAGMPTLPNGNSLPMRAPFGVDLIELDIQQINSKIYVALGQGVAVLGVAVAIKEFDILNRYLPGANIFMGFNIQGVVGNAGIFTGEQSGTSGIGLFVDFSNLLPKAEVGAFEFAVAKSASSFRSANTASSKVILESSKGPTYEQSYGLMKGISKIKSRSRKLSLQ
jgi:hypothetical protein